MKTLQKLLLVSATFVPVFVFAQTSATTTNLPKGQFSTTTIACVQTALEKRENSIITEHDTFNAAIKTALNKRLSGLKDAWGQTERSARISKRQETYKVFKSESQAAHTAMKTARNNAWRTYEADAKACGIKGGTGESPSTISIPNISI